MIEIRPFGALGTFKNEWLKAHFHFSFAEYFDPERMGVGALRVWNDDTIQPGGGFPMHPHSDMEIITYIRKGAITHEDHLGNKGRTVAGDIQVMHAGTGITHSEFNHEDETTQIFQIWITPAVTGVAPGWATRRFPGADRAGQLVTLASGRAGDRGDALEIHQDASFLAATLAENDTVTHDLDPGRRVYLVAVKGGVEVNGRTLGERDGAVIEDETRLSITATKDSEIVLVDTP